MCSSDLPLYIEPAIVPEFGGETSSVTEAKETAPPTQKTEEPATMPKAPSVELAETKVVKDKTEESKTDEVTKMPEILSPSTEVAAPKRQKSSATTPKRRRMANVLDVLETVKTLNSIVRARRGWLRKSPRCRRGARRWLRRLSA